MSQFLTIDEVADLLKVHRNTVARWLHDEKFPNSIAIENTYRIPLSDIEALKTNKKAGA